MTKPFKEAAVAIMHQNNKPLQVISELGKHVKIAETEREKCTE